MRAVTYAHDPRDPAVPDDGACAKCGKPRRPERSKRYGRAAAELDPFCSTECARSHYGVSLRSSLYTMSGNEPGYVKTGPGSFRPGRGRLAK